MAYGLYYSRIVKKGRQTWKSARFDPSTTDPLDKEIIPLCDALNNAEFITTESCSGHGKAWANVFFWHRSVKRIESLARFVIRKELEQGDYRPYFSMWQKEILDRGYIWYVEIHTNGVGKYTPWKVSLEKSRESCDKVAQLINEWYALFGNMNK